MGIKIYNPEQGYVQTILKPINFNSFTATTVYTAGRVYMSRIELLKGQSVSKITFYNWATIAGNITVGIYAEGSSGTPVAGAVLAQSASTAHAGANGRQTITFASAVFLNAGAYYLAFETSDATATIGRNPSQDFGGTLSYYYDRGGGYGALTDPCPASAATFGNIPTMLLVSP
jgi:hypothetical protein